MRQIGADEQLNEVFLLRSRSWVRWVLTAGHTGARATASQTPGSMF